MGFLHKSDPRENLLGSILLQTTCREVSRDKSVTDGFCGFRVISTAKCYTWYHTKYHCLGLLGILKCIAWSGEALYMFQLIWNKEVILPTSLPAVVVFIQEGKVGTTGAAEANFLHYCQAPMHSRECRRRL